MRRICFNAEKTARHTKGFARREGAGDESGAAD
jgi:hypothetical protein